MGTRPQRPAPPGEGGDGGGGEAEREGPGGRPRGLGALSGVCGFGALISRQGNLEGQAGLQASPGAGSRAERAGRRHPPSPPTASSRPRKVSPPAPPSPPALRFVWRSS